MKIIFDHSFGQQEQGEFFHFTCSLEDVAIEEFDHCLETGFLLTIKNNQCVWYQCRSTRLATANSNFALLNNASSLEEPLPATEMDHIYSSYCYHKKFKKYFEIDQRLPQDKFIGYYRGHDLVAWTKMRHYTDRAIETCLFVWDYSDPASRLGMHSLEHEIAWAKQQGYQYVYLGPGYERSSIYKSELPGFEWWTGSTWSKDIDQYRYLCRRDSKIKTVEGLFDV